MVTKTVCTIIPYSEQQFNITAQKYAPNQFFDAITDVCVNARRSEEVNEMAAQNKDAIAKLKAENEALRRDIDLAFLLLEVVASIAEDYRSRLPVQIVEQRECNRDLQLDVLLDKIHNLGKRPAGDGDIIGSDAVK